MPRSNICDEKLLFSRQLQRSQMICPTIIAQWQIWVLLRGGCQEFQGAAENFKGVPNLLIL